MQVNMPMQPEEPCPAGIVIFARERLQCFRASYTTDSRRWFLRRLTPRSPFRLGPPLYVNIRRFSECNTEEMHVHGKWLGWWHVDEGKVLNLAKFASEKKYGRIASCVILNFALISTRHICVINELDVDGNVVRAAYNVNDPNFATLGEATMVLKREKIRRKYGEAWMPTSEI